VATEDLVGILRTLLNSIEAHGWNTGAGRGYVSFLVGVMERGGIPQSRGPQNFFNAKEPPSHCRQNQCQRTSKASFVTFWRTRTTTRPGSSTPIGWTTRATAPVRSLSVCSASLPV